MESGPLTRRLPDKYGLVGAGMQVAGALKHLADCDAAIKQLGAGGFDVGDDQVQSTRSRAPPR